MSAHPFDDYPRLHLRLGKIIVVIEILELRAGATRGGGGG